VEGFPADSKGSRPPIKAARCGREGRVRTASASLARPITMSSTFARRRVQIGALGQHTRMGIGG